MSAYENVNPRQRLLIQEFAQGDFADLETLIGNPAALKSALEDTGDDLFECLFHLLADNPESGCTTEEALQNLDSVVKEIQLFRDKLERLAE